MRDRFNYIMKLFQDEDSSNFRKSGTEEQYDERGRLLTEVLEQQKGTTERKEAQRKQDEADRQMGKQIQIDALKSLKEKLSTG